MIIKGATGRRRARSGTCERSCNLCRQIGTLLAKPLQEDEEFGLHKVLRAAAQRYFSGSMVRMSERIGLNKSTVHGWLNGTVIPEIGRLGAVPNSCPSVPKEKGPSRVI